MTHATVCYIANIYLSRCIACYLRIYECISKKQMRLTIIIIIILYELDLHAVNAM